MKENPRARWVAEAFAAERKWGEYAAFLYLC